MSGHEIELLKSPSRPIVLLERKKDNSIPNAVAPGVKTLGFMLPYAPLHYLLLESSDRPLVMTSGNISDEPICFRDDEASERLQGIAGYFLIHDRPIHIRTDDSVVRSFNDREMVLRRSRGYAPAPIRTAFEFERSLLACGAELKNTFCLARGQNAFVSHHMAISRTSRRFVLSPKASNTTNGYSTLTRKWWPTIFIPSTSQQNLRWRWTVSRRRSRSNTITLTSPVAWPTI
jgi:hydrogenase maturation factor HypF (carbamoyltransferase family)